MTTNDDKNQSDRTLLEQAAKAAGIEIIQWSGKDVGEETACIMPYGLEWNPLTDDGDALRLAVKLRMDLMLYSFCKGAFVKGNQYSEDGTDDPYAATRRAIVRAAAEIGKTL